MITKRAIFIGGAALALALAIFGCNRSDSPPQNTPPPANATTPTTTQNSAPPGSQTPIKDSVEAFLAKNTDGKLLPKNVRLLSANLEEGVVTLDFSDEFQALANMGDSTEAEAQRELRKILAQFSTVEKMRVTVDGERFDSQMTDWYEPFPVRDEDTEDVSQKPEANEGSP